VHRHTLNKKDSVLNHCVNLTKRTKSAGIGRFFQLCGLLFVVIAITALLFFRSHQSVPDVVIPAVPGVEVRKSENDLREYSYLELPNRLRVLLISDPAAEKAAVSLDVAVGSKDDPHDREGLAHFLEHMLFLGTEKYPTAGDYQTFIAANGGQHNAYTSFNNTNYFFDINAVQLEPALDQFSQFFVSPLFTASYVEREKHAVESEYRTKLKDEFRRGLDAFRATLNPAHPFSQFSVGNLETLADRDDSTVRDELLAFYERHYSANRMNLVVLGREPIADLQVMVEQRFAAVEDRDSSVSPITLPLFGEAVLPASLSVVPEQNIRRLALAFPVPDPQPHWRAQPLHLIGDILGHEGEGSLLQYLKDRGWADGLSAGVGVEYRSAAMFNIDVALTEAGYEQRDAVVTAIFQAINRLAQKGISEQRFDEQRKISELRFRYQERSENVQYVTGLAARMAQYPASMILEGPYFFGSFEPDLYREYIELLSPDNVLVTVTGPGLATTAQTPLYQTPYAINSLSEAQADAWQQAGVNPAIRLPAPNPFIPEDFQRLGSDLAGRRPVKLFESPQVSLWHGDDASFALPKASVRLLLGSAMATDTARHAVLLDLYAALVSDSLNPKLYPALLAGFETAVMPSRQGLQVSVQGFSDKQAQLWAMLAAQLQSADFDARRFADVKQRLVRGWQNARRQAPYRYLQLAQREALYQPFWGEAQRLAAIESITLDDLLAFHRNLMRTNRVEMLVYGNLSAADALALRDTIAPLMGDTDSVMDDADAMARNDGIAVVELGDSARWRFEVPLPHSDAAIAWYIQGEDDSNRQRVLMALTGQIIRTPYYQSLRTEQQLGYVVHAAPTILERTPGLTFMVQSPVADAGALYQASLVFMREFGESLDAMSIEEFEQHRLALISLINRPHQNLASVADYMWDQLLQHYWAFDRREQLSGALRELTLEQWRDFYQHEFLPEPRRSMLVFSPGAGETQPGDWSSLESIGSPDTFKQSNALRSYP
jgi:insulysin